MNLKNHMKNAPLEWVHLWFDQYGKDFHKDHRMVLHHHAGLNLFVRIFGEQYRIFGEQHLKDDFVDYPDGIPMDYRNGGYDFVWAYDERDWKNARAFTEQLYKEGEL